MIVRNSMIALVHNEVRTYTGGLVNLLNEKYA